MTGPLLKLLGTKPVDHSNDDVVPNGEPKLVGPSQDRFKSGGEHV
jgi:hypothetical protein